MNTQQMREAAERLIALADAGVEVYRVGAGLRPDDGLEMIVYVHSAAELADAVRKVKALTRQPVAKEAAPSGGMRMVGDLYGARVEISDLSGQACTRHQVGVKEVPVYEYDCGPVLTDLEPARASA